MGRRLPSLQFRYKRTNIFLDSCENPFITCRFARHITTSTNQRFVYWVLMYWSIFFCCNLFKDIFKYASTWHIFTLCKTKECNLYRSELWFKIEFWFIIFESLRECLLKYYQLYMGSSIPNRPKNSLVPQIFIIC